MSTNSISWFDDSGFATLSNLKGEGGNRFGAWTPDRMPIGPAAIGLGTGRTHRFVFRRDDTISFEIAAIPGSELELMLRLKYHLMNDGEVLLTTDRPLAATFATCCIAPDTVPSIEMSDRENMEYTFSVVLKAVNPSPALICNSGLSGLQDFGDDFCAWQPGQYAAFKTDSLTNPNYPPTPHDFADLEGFVDVNLDEEGNSAAYSHLQMVQTVDNGGHRMLDAERRAADSPVAGDAWGGKVVISEQRSGSPLTPHYAQYYMRLVVKFSEDFEIEEGESGVLMYSHGILPDPTGSDTSESEFWLRLIGPVGATPAKVRFEWACTRHTTPSPIVTSGGGDVATYAEVFDGLAHEFLVHFPGHHPSFAAQVSVWFGDPYVLTPFAFEGGAFMSKPAGWLGWTAHEFRFMDMDLTSVPGTTQKQGVQEWEVGGDPEEFDFGELPWWPRVGD